MIVFPNAKINLGLDILRKRDDGFHDIETVFYPIPLKDALEIVETGNGDFLFEQSGLKVDSEKGENLCEKALRILRVNYKIPGAKIHLHKAIPMGAGLGGGSANASFSLKVVNELFNLNLSNQLLRNLASQLGSDCPFFIENTPVIAKGRGEILTKINLSLKGYFLVLVHPAIHISTPKAYSMIKPAIPAQPLQNRMRLPIEKWKDAIKNDFEEPIFKEYPMLKRIKEKLYVSGAIYAAMTGSGSALYGVFDREVDLRSNFDQHFVFQEWLK